MNCAPTHFWEMCGKSISGNLYNHYKSGGRPAKKHRRCHAMVHMFSLNTANFLRYSELHQPKIQTAVVSQNVATPLLAEEFEAESPLRKRKFADFKGMSLVTLDETLDLTFWEN